MLHLNINTFVVLERIKYARVLAESAARYRKHILSAHNFAFARRRAEHDGREYRRGNPSICITNERNRY